MVDRKDETKSERFQRVAAPRATKAIRALKHLERCANRVTYEFSEDEVAKLLGALDERLQALHKAFAPQERGRRRAPQDEFRF